METTTEDETETELKKNFKVNTEDEIDLTDISDLEDNALQTRTGENTTYYYLCRRGPETRLCCGLIKI